ncbi:MAG: HK97 gp10 family phage protein [Aestuariivirga sp.]
MSVKVTGLADVKRVLTDIGPKEATNLMRVVVFDMAKQIATDAAARAPSDEGDLKAGIGAKRERGKRHFLAASVRGSPFYWRYLEYGQGPDGVEHAFFLKTLQALRPDIDRIYLETFVRKLEQRLARQRK